MPTPRHIFPFLILVSIFLDTTGANAADVQYLINPANPVRNFALINFAKTCEGFNNSAKSANNFPPHMNADGYFASSPPKDVWCRIPIPSTSEYPGNWVIRWTGFFGTSRSWGVSLETGIRGGGKPTAATVVGSTANVLRNDTGRGVLELTGENGRVEFNAPGANEITLTFRGNPNGSYVNRITNIAIYRNDREDLYAKGAVFEPDYLQFLKTLHPRILRALGWLEQTNSNRSRYAYQPTVNAMSYNESNYYPGAWSGGAGSTTSRIRSDGQPGAAYLAEPTDDNPNGPYTDGETIQGYVTDACATGNDGCKATLTVNRPGTSGAKRIACWGNCTIPANSLVTFVFSARLNTWLFWIGGFRETNAPVQIFTRLCNEVDADCFFQFPIMFDAPSAKAMAQDIDKGLNPKNQAYFEYSNEVYGANFNNQSVFAFYTGKAIGLPDPLNDFYGLQTRIFGGVIKSLGSARLHMVSTQFAFTDEGAAINSRLGGVNLKLDADGKYTKGGLTGAAIATNYSTAGNRPVDYVDDISTAMYFYGTNVNFTDLWGRPDGNPLDDNYHGNYVRVEESKPWSPIIRRITQISKSDPGIVTAVGSNYRPGDRIYLDKSIQGMVQLQNTWVTVAASPAPTADTFAISDVTAHVARVLINNSGSKASIGHHELETNQLFWLGGGLANGRMLAFSAFAGGDGITWQGPSPGTLPSNPRTPENDIVPGKVYYVSNYRNGAFNICDTNTGCTKTLSTGALRGVQLATLKRPSDTSRFGDYVSGGRTFRQQPGANDALMKAADDYASGDMARMKAALEWFDWDVHQGTRPGFRGLNGALNTPDPSSIYGYQHQVWPAFQKIATHWPPRVLPLIHYEGGYGGIGMTGITAAYLGIDANYPNKITALMQAYKRSEQFRKAQEDMTRIFGSFPMAKAAGQLSDIAGGNLWNLALGLYLPPHYPGSHCPSSPPASYCFTAPDANYTAIENAAKRQ